MATLAKSLGKQIIKETGAEIIDADPETVRATKSGATWGMGILHGVIPILNPLLAPMIFGLIIFITIILIFVFGVTWYKALFLAYLIQIPITALIFQKVTSGLITVASQGMV